MPRDNAALATAARLLYWPLRPFLRRAVHPPRKALILKPCCLSQVMLATPLLAALHQAFPEAQFDWAVSDWARAAVVTNPHVTHVIDTGSVGLPGGRWSDAARLAARLRDEAYDTCFIPSRSSLLSWVAWRAGIRQRIGLRGTGRGFGLTRAVGSPPQHEALLYLGLARALGVTAEPGMTFYPTDAHRARVMRLLVDELGWERQRPLIILHPGGGDNPVRPDPRKRWPPERFALLGNHLVRTHQALIVVAGSEADQPTAAGMVGMMPGSASNLAGRLELGELAALAEVADLYVGNDAGPTHVAAAVGCPTLAIFGPSDPGVSRPFAPRGPLAVLHEPWAEPFSWADRAPVAAAAALADELLRERLGGGEKTAVAPSKTAG